MRCVRRMTSRTNGLCGSGWNSPFDTGPNLIGSWWSSSRTVPPGRTLVARPTADVTRGSPGNPGPAVVALNEGSLADPRVRVLHDDAFTWAATRARGDTPERPFDVVVVDMPDPESLDTVRLYSEEMYRAVAALLASDGRMVVQAGSPYFARQALWSVEATVAAAGLRTTPYHVDVPSFGDWGFVVGAPGDFAPALDEAVTPRFLTAEVVAAAQAFGADAGPVDVEVNTLDDPVLVDYTERGSAY